MSFLVKKYIVNDDDLTVAYRWIRNQYLKYASFPHGNSKSAMEEFYALPSTDSMAINAWCEDNLDSEQWYRLKGVIRQGRHIKKHGLVNRVGVSVYADSILNKISKSNGMTKGQIIDFLVVKYSAAIKL